MLQADCKPTNKTKIGDICPSGKNAIMTFLVNGQPNEEYENRVVREGDIYHQIRIAYRGKQT